MAIFPCVAIACICQRGRLLLLLAGVNKSQCAK